MSAFDLVIFDCDGVLVDSEPLALAIARDALADAGLALDEDMVRETYLGRSGRFLVADAETRLGRRLPGDFLERLADRVATAFRRELKAVPYVGAAVTATNMPACVASSSSHGRIALSLELAGLDDLFGGRIFSAGDVANGKPAPDLYLHAATSCGAHPARCLVIEDSELGVAAGFAAGMTVLGFLGGSHIAPARDKPRLMAAGAARVFSDMRELKLEMRELCAALEPKTSY